MKSEKEKKKLTKSIKISENQQKIINEKADKLNMNFSEYVVSCAVHGNNSLTPQTAVKVQEIVNLVLDLADRLDEKEYVTRMALRQKAQDLDGLFHPEPPEQQFQKITSDIADIVEGGYEVWDSLK